MVRMTLLVMQGKSSRDMTSLVETVVWSGRRGSAARSLKVTLLDDPGYNHGRSKIDCAEGHQCAFYWDKKECFRGMIMRQSTSGKKLTITAYDIGIYLSNNKNSFIYKKKSASEIFTDCMTKLGIPIGGAAEIKHKIKELAKPKTTYFDVICDALAQTYDATGERYFLIAIRGSIYLLKRKEAVEKWVIEQGVNLAGYTYGKSIENTRTRIRLLAENGKLLAEKGNAELEKKVGVFMEVDTPKDSLNAGQLDALANSMLREKGSPEESFSIDALGMADIFSGKCVYVKIKDVDISRRFFVDEDTHTFKGRHHTMKLNLVYKKYIEEIG